MIQRYYPLKRTTFEALKRLHERRCCDATELSLWLNDHRLKIAGTTDPVESGNGQIVV